MKHTISYLPPFWNRESQKKWIGPRIPEKDAHVGKIGKLNCGVYRVYESKVKSNVRRRKFQPLTNAILWKR